MQKNKYSVSTNVYDKVQKIEPGFNTLQIVNLGVSNVIVNNIFELITNQTYTIEGNENEVCVSVQTISFAAGGGNKCLVIRKDLI